MSDVKHSLYNNLSPSSEIDEQIDQAREELNEIDDELSRVLTQQLVLRKRQADLGIYIEKTLKATVRRSTNHSLTIVLILCRI